MHRARGAQTQTALANALKLMSVLGVTFRPLSFGCLFLTVLLSAGCDTVPMTYKEWKQEQAERARYAEAGVPYKTKEHLRSEAGEMRRAAEETTFPARKK